VKGKGFLSILSAAIILAMLLVAIPANLCFAITDDEDIDVSPSSGEIGEEVDIDGDHFEENDWVYIYFSSDNASVGDYIDTDVDTYFVVLETETDDYGEFSDYFDIPDELDEGDDDEDVEDGTYYVYAVYDGDDVIVARDTFSVEEGGGGTGDESISLLPSSACIDGYVEITGEDFEGNETVDFYFSKENASVGEEIDSDVENYELVSREDADSSGIVEADFDVPEVLEDGADEEDVIGGTYYVYATYYSDDEIVARDTITIIANEISLSPTKGTVGTEVRVTGSGFDGSESIDIKFGSTDVAISRGDDDTSSSGSFTSYFNVPENTAGDKTVTVDVSGDEGEADFTVEPAIEIDPADGAVNERILVSGTGFAYRKDVTITFDGDEVGGETTGSYGSFEAYVNVPEVVAGEYKIEAEDTSNNSASATFTISTEVLISPTTNTTSPGYVGDEITISGTGFKSSSDITITYASTPVTFHTTSESDGSFSFSFEVPPSTSGEHTVTADDGISSVSAKFYMESTPPNVPQPLEPYMDGKAKSLAYFDWEDVTADVDDIVEQSLPITYNLQVATNENFTNPLLDIKGIETSEYTLTEDEALEKTSEEFPYYYWRLRAVDAASNASAWTGAGTFTLGFSFKFPDISGWLLYVLMGVGALVLFFVGLLIGRRGGGGDYY